MDDKAPVKPTYVQARTEEIDADAVGQRIDNYLARRLHDVPKRHLYRLLRTGQVRVNGGRIKPLYKLCLADRVRIPPLLQPQAHTDRVSSRLNTVLSNAVLYEDDNWLVLDKPCGLAVQRGSGLHTCVLDILATMRPESSSWHLAHRLDRDTSGCLLLAKNRQALLQLHSAFHENRVIKKYLALVVGHWPASVTKIEAPLLKRASRNGEHKVVIDKDGRYARSDISVERYYAEHTLLQVALPTGRTHQIRVHTSQYGYPIVGDRRYGSQAANKAAHKAYGLARMFLHARSVYCAENPKLDLTCPLPPALTQALDQLPNCVTPAKIGPP